MKHPFPAFLSFFIPGLGQVIKGEVLRGTFFFIATLCSIVTIVGWPIMAIWAVSDAYNHN